ncbi:Putative SOS response-associated peptidase YedK [Planctomycetes bacterium Poly30]|uniref:Abasic site processing protein n=2 Tax=Saltatorellus ferox TaxID=2528018 RepID=A0A518ELH6_9BACT|nr:Putative SOS response-associated peptidase YedK [Planctomycetes bacterium Poly30]
MCGRYALTVEPDVLTALFALKALTEYDRRYNLAPSQEAPVIVRDGASEEHVARTMRWGLVPSWSKDSKIAYKTINARSETAAVKPSFRSAFKRRRCLVPASWFYEWKRDGKEKIPYRIRRVDGDPLAFAGLWEEWNGSGTEAARTTFTILTTSASDDLADLHDRMPCIVERPDFDRWLTPEIEDEEATARLLGPAPAGTLVTDRVSTRVNNVRNEGPELLTPDTMF